MEDAAAAVRALGTRLLQQGRAARPLQGPWPLPGAEAHRTLPPLDVWSEVLWDGLDMRLSPTAVLATNLRATAEVARLAALECDLGAEALLAACTPADLEGVPLSFKGANGEQYPLMPEQLAIAVLLAAGGPRTTLCANGQPWAGGVSGDAPSLAVLGAPMGTGKTLAALAGALALTCPTRFEELKQAKWEGRAYNDDPHRCRGLPRPHDQAVPAPLAAGQLHRAVLVVAIAPLHQQWVAAARALGAEAEATDRPGKALTKGGGCVVVCTPRALSNHLQSEAAKARNCRRAGAAALVIDELAHMSGLPSGKRTAPLRWGAFPRVIAITASSYTLLNPNGRGLAHCGDGNVMRRAIYLGESLPVAEYDRKVARRLQLASLPFSVQSALATAAAERMPQAIWVRNVRCSTASLLAANGTYELHRPDGAAVNVTFHSRMLFTDEVAVVSLAELPRCWRSDMAETDRNEYVVTFGDLRQLLHSRLTHLLPAQDGNLAMLGTLPCCWVSAETLALAPREEKDFCFGELVTKLPCDCGATSAAAACAGCCRTVCAACMAAGPCCACAGNLPIPGDPWAEGGPPLPAMAAPAAAIRCAVTVHGARRIMIVLRLQSGALRLEDEMEDDTRVQAYGARMVRSTVEQLGGAVFLPSQLSQFLAHPLEQLAVLMVRPNSKALAGLDLGLLDVEVRSVLLVCLFRGEPPDPRERWRAACPV